MLNFAEQTGSGAVIVVWSALTRWSIDKNKKLEKLRKPTHLRIILLTSRAISARSVPGSLESHQLLHLVRLVHILIVD